MISEEGSLQGPGKSLVAPLIFIFVVGFQFLTIWLEELKKIVFFVAFIPSLSVTEVQLRAEIKRLLKEASTLTLPSTFAQAAKLRRTAAAKEKELAIFQELNRKKMKSSYDLYLRIVFCTKVLLYFVLICWFWETPVAAISQQLVQPFGRMISWKTAGRLDDKIVIGIIPWLIISTRVGGRVVN